jgi:preprotein translocase subunit SecY
MRVAVTLGALATFRLGAALPLPGLNAERLHGVVATDLTSVFALRVMPMLNVLLLVEIGRLICKRFNDWGAAPANARRINRWMLAATLLLSAFQAYGLAVGFEGISGAVDEPGPEFRLTVVATLVGGTALLAWLAALISRHGVGSGFWILLLTPYLVDLPATILRYAEFERIGVLSQGGVAAILAYVLIAAASLAALGLVLARRGMPLERTLIWPLYISALPVSFLLFVPLLLPAGRLQDTAGALLSPGAPLHVAALAVVIIAVSLAQSRRAAPRLTAGDSSGESADPAAAPVVLTALALASVAVVPHLLKAQLDLPIPIDGTTISTAVGITLGMKSLLSGHRF